MSRGNNNGWDFIEIGKEYQYKEDWLIAIVKILEVNSTEDLYSFKVEVIKSNTKPFNDIFDIEHNKNFSGYYSGMSQLYETPQYMCVYNYKKV